LKYSLALLTYRLFLVVLLPLILLFLLFRSRKNTAYRHRLAERLGFISPSLHSGGVVVHAASVGEVIALSPFIEKLLITEPHLPITLTTFTPTGSAQVKKMFNERVQHCYLPFDIFFCSSLFLKALKPQAIVFMETELWPSLIKQASNRDIKLLLINGRLSTHSMKSYTKIKALMAPTLNLFHKILIQSQSNLTNFIALGADPERCSVEGNLKFDISVTDVIERKKVELHQYLPTERPIWLMASTHEGDEELALQSFALLKKQHPELLLILVPRHPERFNDVAKLCVKHHFTLAKRSHKTKVTTEDVWLLDSLGELMGAYALSDIITIGGSFSEVGGHNPLEPALFKKAIIVGPRMDNFTEINQQLCEVKALVTISALNINQQVEQLQQAVSLLLNNPSEREFLGTQAYRVVMTNQGASERSIAQLQKLVVSTNIQHSSFDNNFYGYDNNLISNFSPKVLNSAYWHDQHAITGSAEGRGTTWFIKSKENKEHWVLRHYYRGGLIGKIINDHYIYTTLEKTRAAAEFTLLSQMQKWELPAPAPVAYQVIRSGIFYQADLLSSRINNAQDLVAILSETKLSDDVWRHIGETIKRFHDKDIYHHDLNSHNILLDDNHKAWLIDFDRGELRSSTAKPDQSNVQTGWKDENLQRLLRSFRKEKNKLPEFHWHEDNWLQLMVGYQK
jgi:3-deoxy-D-manno-octulosonic-acid transferase